MSQTSQEYRPAERVALPLTRCRHIMCKGMGVYGEDYLTPADEGARTSDFWCTRTQTVMGPDSGLVMLSRCDSARSCYEPL